MKPASEKIQELHRGPATARPLVTYFQNRGSEETEALANSSNSRSFKSNPRTDLPRSMRQREPQLPQVQERVRRPLRLPFSRLYRDELLR